MSTEPTLIDTNVLLYALDPQSPQYTASRAVLERTRREDERLRVAPPVLAEFFAVSTDPCRVSQPRSATDALAFIRELLAQPGVKLLATPADLVERWMALVGRRGRAARDTAP